MKMREGKPFALWLIFLPLLSPLLLVLAFSELPNPPGWALFILVCYSVIYTLFTITGRMIAFFEIIDMFGVAKFAVRLALLGSSRMFVGSVLDNTHVDGFNTLSRLLLFSGFVLLLIAIVTNSIDFSKSQ